MKDRQTCHVRDSAPVVRYVHDHSRIVFKVWRAMYKSIIALYSKCALRHTKHRTSSYFVHYYTEPPSSCSQKLTFTPHVMELNLIGYSAFHDGDLGSPQHSLDEQVELLNMNAPSVLLTTDALLPAQQKQSGAGGKYSFIRIPLRALTQLCVGKPHEPQAPSRSQQPLPSSVYPHSARAPLATYHIVTQTLQS